jgi:hypothetical protein
MPGFLRLGLAAGLWLIARDAPPAAAQTDAPPDHRWQLTLDDERYVWDVRLVKLAGDTLIVRQSDSLVRAPIARINEMRILQRTTLRVGDGHESAISTLAGGNDEVYDLARFDFGERRRAIQRILSHYPAIH